MRNSAVSAAALTDHELASFHKQRGVANQPTNSRGTARLDGRLHANEGMGWTLRQWSVPLRLVGWLVGWLVGGLVVERPSSQADSPKSANNQLTRTTPNFGTHARTHARAQRPHSTRNTACRAAHHLTLLIRCFVPVLFCCNIDRLIFTQQQKNSDQLEYFVVACRG